MWSEHVNKTVFHIMFGHSLLNFFCQIYEFDFAACGNSQGFVVDVQRASLLMFLLTAFVFKVSEKVKRS